MIGGRGASSAPAAATPLPPVRNVERLYTPRPNPANAPSSPAKVAAVTGGEAELPALEEPTPAATGKAVEQADAGLASLDFELAHRRPVALDALSFHDPARRRADHRPEYLEQPRVAARRNPRGRGGAAGVVGRRRHDPARPVPLDDASGRRCGVDRRRPALAVRRVDADRRRNRAGGRLRGGDPAIDVAESRSRLRSKHSRKKSASVAKRKLSPLPLGEG